MLAGAGVEIYQLTVRVLVADDDPVTLRTIGATLESFGYEVTLTKDGASAWEFFRKKPFPAVITDWEMPRLDGLSLCRRIRETYPSTYTYIIVLTSRRRRQYMIESLSAGADDFVSKPLRREELRVRLRTAERLTKLETSLRNANHELRRMNQRLLEMSRLDPLMEISNRLAFEEEFEAFHQQAVKSGLPYGIVMSDVDHFKLCNDTFGHQRGDEVLRQLAAAVRSKLRAHDRAFRYGGEEILILLLQQDLQGAVGAAERLRHCIEDLEFHNPKTGRNFRITISCGVACFPLNYDPESGWEGLIECADRALYQAKSVGRNCVVATVPGVDSVSFLNAESILQQTDGKLVGHSVSSKPLPGDTPAVPESSLDRGSDSQIPSRR